MWWIIGLVIGGIIGIANEILESLQKEVAVERKRWEDSYQQVLEEVCNRQGHIQNQLKTKKNILNFKELCDLHSTSIQIADRTYELLQGSRKTLDAMGRAIVETAKQRKILEQRKRNSSFWEKGGLEKQILSLHKLRDEILTPDKDKVKNQKNMLLSEVKKLNMQTSEIKILKNEIKKNDKKIRALEKSNYFEQCYEGKVKFFDANKGFGFISCNSSEISDVYFNQKQIQNQNFLNNNEKVKFIIKKNRKRTWAECVERL
ncbi:cold shock domain-containing protein [Desulfococcaceae bacterium HSG9]|nr:cold shock domain-containing protein [Desulfococcaceae bacterium HSG9]